jgi:integrase/recombinase XerD
VKHPRRKAVRVRQCDTVRQKVQCRTQTRHSKGVAVSATSVFKSKAGTKNAAEKITNMKKLSLSTAAYQYLEKGFKEWLDILGYNAATVYGMPHIIREFLHFLEHRNIQTIQALQHKDIKAYHDHISGRANQRRGGGLSANTLNKQLQGLTKFLEYLHHKGISNLPSMGITFHKGQKEQMSVLTQTEVKLLFAATSKDAVAEGHPNHTRYNEATQGRDHAMLVVYYSCGLRRSEGIHLHTDDINLDTCVLHVKKGKNCKERFVPFNKTNATHLQTYLYDHRPLFSKDKKEGRLFIGAGGQPLAGGTQLKRLQRLQQLTEDTVLQQKTVGLHTLRHSIATHLLQAGMSLEKIAQFLGHNSLASTQIYTHLIDKE